MTSSALGGMPMPDGGDVLRTSVGDFPLHEYNLRLAGRAWSILHTGAVLGFWEEQRYLSEQRNRSAYGVALWSSAIALAHELAARGDALRGTTVLELGAGTGLPGIVAASSGARVVQTDRGELPLSIGRRNGERNGVSSIEYRVADWTAWSETARYDWILGSDTLYSEPMHPHLRRIFDTNLAPGGRVLLSDPFRSASLRLLEAMEADGWVVAMTKWSVAEGEETRAVGVFELAPPSEPR